MRAGKSAPETLTDWSRATLRMLSARLRWSMPKAVLPLTPALKWGTSSARGFPFKPT